MLVPIFGRDVSSVVRTRSPGAALVDEARQRGSEIVYFDMGHAPPTDRSSSSMPASSDSWGGTSIT